MTNPRYTHRTASAEPKSTTNPPISAANPRPTRPATGLHAPTSRAITSIISLFDISAGNSTKPFSGTSITSGVGSPRLGSAAFFLRRYASGSKPASFPSETTGADDHRGRDAHLRLEDGFAFAAAISWAVGGVAQGSEGWLKMASISPSVASHGSS